MCRVLHVLAVFSLLGSRVWATTLVAAHYRGGIIVGADTHTSRGGYVSNKAANKLRLITPSLVLARSGNAADTQALAEKLTLELRRLFELEDNSCSLIHVASHIMSRHCFDAKDSLAASLICAGWDSHSGLQIYSIPQGGSLIECRTYALSGSGGRVINAFCDDTWREDMTKSECAAFVARAVDLAIDRDTSSGGGVHLLCIEPDGQGFRQIPLPSSSSSNDGTR